MEQVISKGRVARLILLVALALGAPWFTLEQLERSASQIQSDLGYQSLLNYRENPSEERLAQLRAVVDPDRPGGVRLVAVGTGLKCWGMDFPESRETSPEIESVALDLCERAEAARDLLARLA